MQISIDHPEVDSHDSSAKVDTKHKDQAAVGYGAAVSDIPTFAVT